MCIELCKSQRTSNKGGKENIEREKEGKERENEAEKIIQRGQTCRIVRKWEKKKRNRKSLS